MNISEKALNLIKSFEGFKSEPYKCVAGYNTIGYGHVIKPYEDIQFITEAEALDLLRKDIIYTENRVLNLTKILLTQNQLDALVCFTFNVGTGAYQRSTLRSKVNRGEHKDVPMEFMRWVYVNGVAVKGLTNRRFAEAELYSG